MQALSDPLSTRMPITQRHHWLDLAHSPDLLSRTAEWGSNAPRRLMQQNLPVAIVCFLPSAAQCWVDFKDPCRDRGRPSSAISFGSFLLDCSSSPRQLTANKITDQSIPISVPHLRLEDLRIPCKTARFIPAWRTPPLRSRWNAKLMPDEPFSVNPGSRGRPFCFNILL